MVKDHSEDTQNNSSIELTLINQKLDSIIDLLKIIATNGLSNVSQSPSIDPSHLQDKKSLRNYFKLDKQVVVNPQEQAKITQLETIIKQLQSTLQSKERERQEIINQFESDIKTLRQASEEKDQLCKKYLSNLQNYQKSEQILKSLHEKELEKNNELNLEIKNVMQELNISKNSNKLLQLDLNKLKEELNKTETNNNNLLKENSSFKEQIKKLNNILENSYQLPGIETTIENFKFIVSDSELMSFFALNGKDNQIGSQLVRFIAKAAQWNDVQKVWDHLAKKCKSEHRAATTIEISLLKEIVKIHNLVYRDKSASLYIANPGDRYDYKQMQRGNNASSGDTITEMWLPGLKNPAQGVEKPVLVNTD